MLRDVYWLGNCDDCNHTYVGDKHPTFTCRICAMGNVNMVSQVNWLEYCYVMEDGATALFTKFCTMGGA